MIKRKGLVLKPLEKTGEQKFLSFAKKRGCIVRKFKGKKGDPDRVIFCPGGQTLFIEFKRPGEDARPEQWNRMQELADLGYTSALCNDFDSACDALTDFLNRNETDSE
jgi:hypothetical protein